MTQISPYLCIVKRSWRTEATMRVLKRAAQFRAALVQLGPAFVKIGQAVSSRPVSSTFSLVIPMGQDVVSPAYLEELALLQDRIAPFSTELALQIIEEDLGVSMEQIFTEISPQPIAAASLGQVYQAHLRPNGKLLAVKVQRPGVRAAMALDAFILRKLASYAKSLLKLNTDLPVGVFCSLTQLLDSGFCNADPHPGNLFCTPDDFGMMGEMKENLRDGLIEASVLHVNRQFDALAGNFVTLGLLPPTTEKKGEALEAPAGGTCLKQVLYDNFWGA